MTIKFYESGQDYDIFSNVTDLPFRFKMNGIVYNPRSSEAVYQGLKGVIGGQFQQGINLINDQNQPGSHLQKKGRQFSCNLYFSPYRYDPNVTVRERVMQEILEMKFSQDPKLAKALLDTKGEWIIENTFLNKNYDDSFWGNGHAQNGQNKLGKLLMKIRRKFSEELQKDGCIKERLGFSPMLSKQMGITSTQFSGKILTQQGITAAPSVKTVRQVKNIRNTYMPLYLNETNNTNIPLSSVPSKQSALEFVSKTLQNQFDNNISAKMSEDIYKPGQHVLKISSPNINTLKLIAQKINGGKLINNVLILNGHFSQKLFNMLGIGVYGKTGKYKTFSALEYDFRHSTQSKRNKYV